MIYWYWFIGNILFLLLISLFIILFDPAKTGIITFAKLSATLSVFLFLTNASMYIIFTAIRKTKSRDIKISIVKLSRKIFKFHIPIAITATSLINFHAFIMIFYKGAVKNYFDLSILFGVLAYLLLISTLISGYYRYRRASGLRKKTHRYFALSFVTAFIIHILL